MSESNDDILLGDGDLGDEDIDYDLANEDEEALLADDFDINSSGDRGVYIQENQRAGEQHAYHAYEEPLEDVLDLGVNDDLDSEIQDTTETVENIIGTRHESMSYSQLGTSQEQSYVTEEAQQQSDVDEAQDGSYAEANNSTEKEVGAESEDEEEGEPEEGRERFKSERTNIVSLKSDKNYGNIPDSLDSVVTADISSRQKQQTRDGGWRGRRGRGAFGPRSGNMRGGMRPQYNQQQQQPYLPRFPEGSPGFGPGPGHAGGGNMMYMQQPNSQPPPQAPHPRQEGRSQKILINPHFRGAVQPHPDESWRAHPEVYNPFSRSSVLPSTFTWSWPIPKRNTLQPISRLIWDTDRTHGDGLLHLPPSHDVYNQGPQAGFGPHFQPGQQQQQPQPQPYYHQPQQPPPPVDAYQPTHSMPPPAWQGTMESHYKPFPQGDSYRQHYPGEPPDPVVVVMNDGNNFPHHPPPHQQHMYQPESMHMGGQHIGNQMHHPQHPPHPAHSGGWDHPPDNVPHNFQNQVMHHPPRPNNVGFQPPIQRPPYHHQQPRQNFGGPPKPRFPGGMSGPRQVRIPPCPRNQESRLQPRPPIFHSQQKRVFESAGPSREVVQVHFDTSPPKRPKRMPDMSNLHEVQTIDTLPDTTVTEPQEQEDEETREYRKKIEEQKKLREHILRQKEERRKLAALKKQRELQQQKQQPQQPQQQQPDTAAKPQTTAAVAAATPFRPEIPQGNAIATIVNRNTVEPSRPVEMRLGAGRGLRPQQAQGMVRGRGRGLARGRGGAIGRGASVQQAPRPPVGTPAPSSIPPIIRKVASVMPAPGQRLVRAVAPQVQVPQRRLVLNQSTAPGAGAVQGTRQVQQVGAPRNRTVVLRAGAKPEAVAGPTQRVVMQKQQVVPKTVRMIVPTPGLSAASEAGIVRSNVVSIDNLAASTTEMVLRRMCQGVGILEGIQMVPSQRRAVLSFTNPSSAAIFCKKYHRKMIDLSLVNATLVSQ